VYYYARRYDQARYHLSRAVAMNPTAAESFRVLGLVLAHQEQWNDAERVIRDGLALPAAGAYTTAALGWLLARTGRRAQAEVLLGDLEAESRRDYVSPVAFATLYLGLGDHARSLEWLERAYAERRGWLAYLRVNPLLDPLRDEPGFKVLLEKVRL
jgi:serine/threonine-protein kinase